MFLETSAYSFSLLLICTFALKSREIEGANNGGGELTQESAVIGGKVSLLCPNYVSGTVAWQFNDPTQTSAVIVAANGKISAKYSSRFSLEKSGADAHIVVISQVTSGDAGLYSCHPDNNAEQKQYVFLRVFKVDVTRNDTSNGTDGDGSVVTTPSPYDWDKMAVGFYLVLLAIIFAVFIGVMIVLCFKVQKSRFGLGKKKDQSTVDAEQQRLQSTSPQPGPSNTATKT